MQKSKNLILIYYFAFYLILCNCVNSGFGNSVPYQNVPTTCNQGLVFVNGRYYQQCPNGYIGDNGVCYSVATPQCPHNYVLYNGLCYPQNTRPTETCPNGYNYWNNNCYPIIKCDASITTPIPPIYVTSLPPNILPPTIVEPTPITEPAIIATEAPITIPEPVVIPPPEPYIAPTPATIRKRCPPDSVFQEGKCRKLICPLGELRAGFCIQSACPDGTVWRGGRCQEPNFITTIIEIENVFKNEAHYKRGKVNNSNVNDVQVFTLRPTPAVEIANLTTTTTTTTKRPRKKITKRPKPIPTSAPLPPDNFEISTVDSQSCCAIVTPRICRSYGKKWVCFNKHSNTCDKDLCQYPLIYLRVPEPIYQDTTLVMPPYPPKDVCKDPGCDTKEVNCSGCSRFDRENCSSYCYNYLCPNNGCHFIDIKEYCQSHPGGFGCRRNEGCLWDWCYQ